jgi:hypothetical protein
MQVVELCQAVEDRRPASFDMAFRKKQAAQQGHFLPQYRLCPLLYPTLPVFCDIGWVYVYRSFGYG